MHTYENNKYMLHTVTNTLVIGETGLQKLAATVSLRVTVVIKPPGWTIFLPPQ